jgi:hypothetical protein
MANKQFVARIVCCCRTFSIHGKTPTAPSHLCRCIDRQSRQQRLAVGGCRHHPLTRRKKSIVTAKAGEMARIAAG